MNPILLQAAAELAPCIGVAAACRAVGLNRASFYRRQTAIPALLEGAPCVGTPCVGTPCVGTPLAECAIRTLTSTTAPVIRHVTDAPTAENPPCAGDGTTSTRRACPVRGRALTLIQRKQVLEVLHSERFADLAPPQVYATLLDENVYLCSISTMYRLLGEHHEVRERRNQLRHPTYTKPELLATAPNQLWSWDITKLLGPEKWTYYYLYVLLDVFSRYVVGWTIAFQENAAVAEAILRESYLKQNILPGQLTVHADRGSAMTSKPVAFLLADLGVTKTHSRPHVSNDNPFSEAQFKTLKYRPDFPDRFGSMPAARNFCQDFFPWYNKEHHHSALALLTPEVVHYGQAQQVLNARQQVLDQAYQRHPERFVRRAPTTPGLPQAVWINPPPSSPEVQV